MSNKCNDNNVTRQIVIQDNITGRNGLSAYEIAIKEGKIPYDWTEDQFIDSLKGETGAQGIQGIPGVSITDIDRVNDELIISKSNGDSINLGNIKGDKGDQGDPLPYSEWSPEDVNKLIQDVSIDDQRIRAIDPGVLPTPPHPDMYMVVTGVGAYTYGGATIGTNAEGYQTTFWWDGTAWSNNGSVKVKGDTGASGTTNEPYNVNRVGGYSAGDIIIENGVTYQVKAGESLSTGQAPSANLSKVDIVDIRDLTLYERNDIYSERTTDGVRAGEGFHTPTKTWLATGGGSFRFYRFDEDLYITANQDFSQWKAAISFFNEDFEYTNQSVEDFLVLGSKTDRKLLSFSTHGSKGYYIGFNSLDNQPTKAETKEVIVETTFKKELIPESNNDILINSQKTKINRKHDVITNVSDGTTDITRYYNTSGATTTLTLEDGKLKVNASLPAGSVSRLGGQLSTAYMSAIRYVVIVLEGTIKATNIKRFNLRNAAGNPFYIIADNIVDNEVTPFKFVIKHFFDHRNANSTWNMFTEYVRQNASNPATVEVIFSKFKFVEFNDFATDADYLSVGINGFEKIKNVRKYEGKKLVTLGHSIVYQNEWQKVLSAIIGADYNYLETSDRIKPLAIGGATIRAVHTNATEWNFATDGANANGKKHSTIWYRARYIKELNPDIIGVMSATNDSSSPALVGTVDDPAYMEEDEKLSTDPSAPTFCASLKGIFEKLLTDNPKALIFYCSLARNWFYNPANGIGEITGNRYAQFLAEKACCERYGVIFVDLLNDSGISHYNAKVYYKADSDETSWQAGASARVHPNSLGGELIAKTVSKHI